MTPAEFKAARHSLDLSARHFGYIVQVDSRTIRRWEGGNQAIPFLAVDYMQRLLDGYRPDSWAEFVAGRKGVGS